MFNDDKWPCVRRVPISKEERDGGFLLPLTDDGLLKDELDKVCAQGQISAKANRSRNPGHVGASVQYVKDTLAPLAAVILEVQSDNKVTLLIHGIEADYRMSEVSYGDAVGQWQWPH